jgi:hypothetical protein
MERSILGEKRCGDFFDGVFRTIGLDIGIGADWSENLDHGGSM